MSDNYYKILGVEQGVSDAELKKAFRKKAMKCHPDRHTGDSKKAAEEEFKKLQQAYEVLSDPQKRAMYDQYGEEAVSSSASGGPGGFHQGAGGFNDIFDIFDNIFGGNGDPRSGSRQGANLTCEIHLSLEGSARGVTKEMTIPKHVTCSTCSGSGAKPGSKPKRCGTCQGAGQVRLQQGVFSVQQTCPRCQGQGQVIRDPCGPCQGQGVVREQKNLIG